jgi:Tfp pilus assembly protein PilZ
MRSTDRFAVEDVRCELAGAAHDVADLSVGGFFVAADTPLPVGQSVAFELTFPDGWRVKAVGRVAWVNGPDGARRAELPIGFGITVTQIAFPDKLAIIGRLRSAVRQPEPVAARPGRPAGPVPPRTTRVPRRRKA